jgi:hypothetical protein
MMEWRMIGVVIGLLYMVDYNECAHLWALICVSNFLLYFHLCPKTLVF